MECERLQCRMPRIRADRCTAVVAPIFAWEPWRTLLRSASGVRLPEKCLQQVLLNLGNVFGGGAFANLVHRVYTSSSPVGGLCPPRITPTASLRAQSYGMPSNPMHVQIKHVFSSPSQRKSALLHRSHNDSTERHHRGDDGGATGFDIDGLGAVGRRVRAA